MTNKTISKNILRIYLVAAIIAVFTASLLPITSRAAAANLETNQASIILNGVGILPIKSMEAAFVHSKNTDLPEPQPGSPAVLTNESPSDPMDEVSILEEANNETVPFTPKASVEVVADEVPASPAQTSVERSIPVSSSTSALESFISQVSNGNGGQVTGIYSDNLFSLSVVQQPSGQAGYVSTSGNTVTQFSMASGLGFLAHNYLSGSLFFSLYGGAPITVVYGDGQSQSYRVSQIRQFQALSPDSPYSDFIDLASGESLSATDLFYQTYGVGGQLVLQTCISSNGISSWGRLFIIATPAG